MSQSGLATTPGSSASSLHVYAHHACEQAAVASRPRGPRPEETGAHRTRQCRHPQPAAAPSRTAPQNCTSSERDPRRTCRGPRRLAASPLTQASAKETINALVDGADASAAEEIFDQWVGEWTSSVDRLEGPRAFLERRAPAFTWARRS
jgi:hypothetical protein